MSAPERTAPEECAQCGAEIPPRARACPECGADERTGWREQSIYDGLDLPDAPARAPRSLPLVLWHAVTWVVLVVIAAFVVCSALGLR